jgi:AraC-like DNA-binding protein
MRDRSQGDESPWRIFVPSVVVPERLHEDEHMLLWQVRGTSDAAVETEDYRLRSGSALWVPAGAPHSLTVRENSVLLPMSFDLTHTATTLRTPTVIAVDSRLRTLLLAKVQTECSIIQPAANIDRQILAMIESSPGRSTALPMPATEAALTVAETLRFNPGDDHTLAELAASVHASVRTIERAFVAETGMTFRQWRIHNRMEAAAILLRTASNLEAVANRVGYLNASAFGRAFKEHFGTTPHRYALRFRT